MEIGNPIPALLGFVFEKRRYRPPIAALCKPPTKNAGISLSITAVCKNARKKALGQDDFFVVILHPKFHKFDFIPLSPKFGFVSNSPPLVRFCY